MKQVPDAAEFDALLKESGDKTIFVDFTATWCGPCKMIGPEFEKLAGENADAVFVKVDVDENEAVSAKYGVRAMPTFMVFKNGEKKGEMVGADKAKLAEFIQANK
mmetsp:Transcript_23922/g.48274  ORF Transcript_23922/g.48274 Transcript_23922/m.48274 type:complete len:105 (+) Transcript_23922:119-433(+)